MLVWSDSEGLLVLRNIKLPALNLCSFFQVSDFDLLRHLLDRITWEMVLKGIGVQEGWTFFKKEVLMAQEQVVPRCCKRSRRQRRTP